MFLTGRPLRESISLYRETMLQLKATIPVYVSRAQKDFRTCPCMGLGVKVVVNMELESGERLIRMGVIPNSTLQGKALLKTQDQMKN